MSANRRKSASRLRAEDKPWVYAMATLAAFMVLVVVWRFWQDRQPPIERLGAVLLEVPREGNMCRAPYVMAAQLTTPGSVLAIKSGPWQGFVVLTVDNLYQVYGGKTAEGKQIKYDDSLRAFVYAKNPRIGFDRRTGNPLDPTTEDRLIRFPSRSLVDALEITLIPQ